MFVSKEKSNIKNTEAYQKALEKAKMTGKKLLLTSGMEACNNPEEECNFDIVDKYVFPNGNIKIDRYHTC